MIDLAHTKHFIDTNILVYAYDSSNPKKQDIARDYLLSGLNTGMACISAQVLSEFISVVGRKISNPLTLVDINEIMNLLLNFHVVEITKHTIMGALAIIKEYKLSLWDAQIIYSAQFANCNILLSEDLSHGRTYQTVKVVNPFSPRQ